MTINYKKTIIAVALLASMALAGCTSGLGGKDYGRSQTRGEASVRIGTIVDVSEAKIDGTRTGIGAAAGTVIGAVAGANNRNSVKGQLGGAIAGIIGGIVGQGAEQLATKKKGIELIIDLGDNKLKSVVQEDDGTVFNKGDKVRLTNAGGDTRVVPLSN